MRHRSSKQLTPFGKAVKKRLVDLDMDQKDLANAIGASAPLITYIIYGDRSDENWIEPICRVLGLDLRLYRRQTPLPAPFEKSGRSTGHPF